jgi:hypothetical protein
MPMLNWSEYGALILLFMKCISPNGDGAIDCNPVAVK